MAKKKSVVFLFGAGASRGALDGVKGKTRKVPIDRDFFDIASRIGERGTPSLASWVTSDVHSLYGRVNGIGLEEYFRDIETRAEIGQFAKTRNKQKDWNSRKTNLEELIRRVLLQTTWEEDEQTAKISRSPIHEKIISRAQPGDTLITFNYDTLIEESLRHVKSPYWDPSDGYGLAAGGHKKGWSKNWREQRKSEAKSGSEVKLLKLHGSLNWTLYNNDSVRLKPKPYVVRTRKRVPVYESCAILPPGWHKRIDKNPFKKLWREARLKLESCQHIVVIGYSMPETDFLAKALFAEVSRMRAARKNFLKSLIVAEPNREVSSRVVNAFVPALGFRGKVFQIESIQELARIWELEGFRR
jgi:hypothetical protein